jgi:hypothetical protein
MAMACATSPGLASLRRRRLERWEELQASDESAVVRARMVPHQSPRNTWRLVRGPEDAMVDGNGPELVYSARVGGFKG